MSQGATKLARPQSYTIGTLTALNQAITLRVPEGQSSWAVYLNGTFSATSRVAFEGSPDSINWFALNGRRNTDAATNEATNFIDANPFGGPSPTGANPSNWRGVIGGIRFFRVRCSAFTTADAIGVQISTSTGPGATFFNAGLPASTNLIGFTGTEFAAEARQGRAYSATSTRLTATLPATAANLLTIYNPAASGKTIYIDRVSLGGAFGNNVNAGFDRVRFTSVPSGGTVVTPVSRNSSTAASVADVRRANVTAGAIGGIAGVTGAQQETSVNIVTGGQDKDDVDGSLVLPPGVGLAIQFTTAGTATTVSAQFAWHEL